MTHATHCRYCGRPIRWALIKATKRRIPLDPGDADAGDVDANIATSSDALGSLFARVLSAQDPLRPDERRARTHFATCASRPARRRSQARKSPSTAP